MSWTGIGLCMGTIPDSLTWVDDHKESFVCVGLSVDARHDMDESELISIHVKNPRKHIQHGWCQYTDYEIEISINSNNFVKPTPKVRRRYSEFAWLQKQLSRHASITTNLPPLPKRKLFGWFDKDFLEKRRHDLQEYLVSVVQITPLFSDVALHLFLRTNLSIKEMESILSGQETTSIVKIEEMLEQKESHPQEKKCSRSSAGDSGYSESSASDETIKVVAEDWVSLYVNHANGQIMGNGWSSGLSCASSGLPYESSCSSRAASVLPSGQLIVPSLTPKEGGIGLSLGLDKSQRNDESCLTEEREHYDADDEVDYAQSDYEVIPGASNRLRVRKWLNSNTIGDYDDCDSSDEEERTVNEFHFLDYDVISVPCSKKEIMRYGSSYSAGYYSNEKSYSGTCEKSDDNDEDNCSNFSMVHSSIDSLNFNDRDELSVSIHSSSSAALFMSYDVVEMIELKYQNVV